MSLIISWAVTFFQAQRGTPQSFKKKIESFQRTIKFCTQWTFKYYRQRHLLNQTATKTKMLWMSMVVKSNSSCQAKPSQVISSSWGILQSRSEPICLVIVIDLFCRGHGTYLDSESTVISSVAGVVERVNKLISVRALKARYTGEIGDIVVGRITEVPNVSFVCNGNIWRILMSSYATKKKKKVAPKRWKVDVNGRQDAILMLSAISLPGGIQVSLWPTHNPINISWL